MDYIKEEEFEAFELLQAANVNEEMLLQFSRDDLQDLFHGPENFLLRRRLWTIIEKSRNQCDLEVEEVLSRSQINVEPSTKVNCSMPGRSPSLQMPSSPDQRFFPISKTCSPQVSSSPAPSSIHSTPTSKSSSPIVPTSPNPSEIGNAPDDMDVVKCQPSPTFVVYCDSELSYAAKNGTMSDVLFSRLVRSQMSNMRSELHRLPVPREPNNSELADMARALCRKYPCLRKTQVRGENGEKTFSEVPEEEMRHLTDHQRNNLHIFVLNRLKKRMYNSRPVKRPQGKTPARGIKRLKQDIPQPVDANNSEETQPLEEPSPMPQDISERHYSALQKEFSKKKPNKAVVNQYLNLEFKERRKFVETTPKALRPAKVLERYPCFKDVTEIVEEVRRTLLALPEEDVGGYQRNCEQRLVNHVDMLIYFGIAKGVLKPPRGQSTDTKVLHLMKGINMLFKSKAKALKSKVDVIQLLEEGDAAPATWLQKKGTDSPGLLLTKDNGSMLYLGSELLARFDEGQIAKAVVSFLASFYLLDLDYPPTWLLSLSILQKLVFEDKSVHPDCQADAIKAFQELEQYNLD